MSHHCTFTVAEMDFVMVLGCFGTRHPSTFIRRILVKNFCRWEMGFGPRRRAPRIPGGRDSDAFIHTRRFHPAYGARVRHLSSRSSLQNGGAVIYHDMSVRAEFLC